MSYYSIILTVAIIIIALIIAVNDLVYFIIEDWTIVVFGILCVLKFFHIQKILLVCGIYPISILLYYKQIWGGGDAKLFPLIFLLENAYSVLCVTAFAGCIIALCTIFSSLLLYRLRTLIAVYIPLPSRYSLIEQEHKHIPYGTAIMCGVLYVLIF